MGDERHWCYADVIALFYSLLPLNFVGESPPSEWRSEASYGARCFRLKRRLQKRHWNGVKSPYLMTGGGLPSWEGAITFRICHGISARMNINKIINAFVMMCRYMAAPANLKLYFAHIFLYRRNISIPWYMTKSRLVSQRNIIDFVVNHALCHACQ